jgi:hypothetical protein
MYALRFRLLLSCLIFVLISRSAAAQQPDVRVSPDEPAGYQGNPGIFLRNGGLYCTWIQSGSNANVIGQWSPLSQQPSTIVAVQSFTPPAPTSFWPTVEVKSSSTGSWFQELRTPQGTLNSNFQYIQYYVLIHYTQNTAIPSVLTSTNFTILRAESDRWQTLLSIADAAPPYRFAHEQIENPFNAGTISGYDPNREEVLAKVVSYVNGLPKRFSLYWCGKNGEVTTLPNIAALSSSEITTISKDPNLYLPVDSLQYLRILDSSVTWKREQTTVAEYSFTTGGPGVHYQRILGPYFLRRFWNESTGSDMRIELYHVDGTLINANIVHLMSRTDDMMLVQHPADSSITIVYADSSGVHLTYLNRLMHNISGNVDLSATRDYVARPAAVWRNDTLFAVWEDYRNGNADVYGNWIERSALYSSASTPVSAEQKLTLQPNPAHDRIRITLPDQRGSTLAIIDMMGQVVHQIPVDAGRSVLDVSIAGLPAGFYMVRYQPQNGPAAFYRMAVTH